MKTITNKETKIQSEKDIFMTRADLLKITLNEAPEKGMSVQEMRSRLKCLKALDKPEEQKIKIEDADFVVLKRSFDTYGWMVIHADIVDLSDHLEEVVKQKD